MTALIIIYNHKFEKNISILESLYKDRFSKIYHLMPFYRGDRENVISVYESSYYFQGYIAQGCKTFYEEKISRYVFIGDDVLLHPAINENNIDNYFGTDDDTCFIPHAYPFGKQMGYWNRNKDALKFKYYNNDDSKYGGVEALQELPPLAEAKDLLKRHGFEVESLYFEQLYGKLSMKSMKGWKNIFTKIYHLLLNNKYNLKYPLLGSYSDIFVVNKNTILDFAHYCGVFAACDLHVEIAIPTAMALASPYLSMENNSRRGITMWNESDMDWLTKYNFQLDSLCNDIPADVIYLHPIKLSKWK